MKKATILVGLVPLAVGGLLAGSYAATAGPSRHVAQTSVPLFTLTSAPPGSTASRATFSETFMGGNATLDVAPSSVAPVASAQTALDQVEASSPMQVDASAPSHLEFGLWTNRSYGHINSDGTITPYDVQKPVWLVQVSATVVMHGPAPESGAGPAPVSYRSTVYGLVDADTGKVTAVFR